MHAHDYKMATSGYFFPHSQSILFDDDDDDDGITFCQNRNCNINKNKDDFSSKTQFRCCCYVRFISLVCDFSTFVRIVYMHACMCNVHRAMGQCMCNVCMYIVCSECIGE